MGLPNLGINPCVPRAPDEFRKVNGMESAKQIWDTLKVSFEGDRSVRKCNIELLHGELERFVFLQNETTQSMFDSVYTRIWKKDLRSSSAPEIMSARDQLRTDRNQMIRMQR